MLYLKSTLQSFLFASACITPLALVVGQQQEACSDVEILGGASWERFDGSLDISVNDDCMYNWTMTFRHDETLPLPTDPAAQCDPSIVPPAIADDGLPYFGARWNYEMVPDYFSAATGINHISLDFNPCGHPPANVFTAPHYDFHTYRVSPEYRTCMVCQTFPGAPTCDFTTVQATDFGRAYFLPVTQDIPPTFISRETDAVQYMGGHAWNPADEPVSAQEWTEPVLVMGTYNGTNLFYEPMPPLSFVTGTEDKFWEENITYANQTTDNLATYVSLSYDAQTGYATGTFVGPSSICKQEFEELKNPSTTSTPTTTTTTTPEIPTQTTVPTTPTTVPTTTPPTTSGEVAVGGAVWTFKSKVILAVVLFASLNDLF